ncbi:hypothetical protein T492DRAFT_851130 [Pavlovales sp. CCMP2436]|nr:hypothetical protein T492DRAFT_851130 [Pavlovales sp. CCMP2436]
MEQYIYDSLEIFVKFTEKPMDKGVDLSKCPIKTIFKQNPNRIIWDGNIMRHFNGIRWEECEDIIKVFAFSNRIFDDLMIKYKYASKKVLGNIVKVYDNIGNSNTAESCLKQFKGVVLDINFGSKADSIVGLIGFNNGILDLREDVPVREGYPSDYVTLNTRIDFSFIDEDVDKYIDDNIVFGPKNLSKSERFIIDIVHEDDYTPLLTILGNILIGGYKEQKTTFFTGSGSNGKSLLSNLLENILEANMLELKGRLLGYTAETSGNKFLSEVFKKTSAEDTIILVTGFDNLNTNLFSDPLVLKAFM